jgi:hypothetical protein
MFNYVSFKLKIFKFSLRSVNKVARNVTTILIVPRFYLYYKILFVRTTHTTHELDHPKAGSCSCGFGFGCVLDVVGFRPTTLLFTLSLLGKHWY